KSSRISSSPVRPSRQETDLIRLPQPARWLRQPGLVRRQLSMPQAVAPLLSVQGVTLRYRTKDHLVTATYRVSFDVYRSDRFVIVGPSGCGKSTLLKAVGGYLPAVEGKIRLNGQEIAKPGPDRVMVFQEF